MRAYWDLLRRERDFRRVFVSELVSLGGDWFALVPLLALLPRLTGSGAWGGLVLAADTAVFALLSPYAGSVVDRLDRRRIMVGADLVSAVLILGLLLVRSSGTAWVALVALSGVAGAKAFYSPAAAAALPNLVDAEDLPVATVLNGATWGTMLAVGAGVGGLAASVLGPRACFVIDAGSFLLSAWFTWRTTRPFGEDRRHLPRAGVRADLRETAAFARTDPRVVGLLACKVGPSIGNGAIAMFPIFAATVFGYGRDDVAFAVGMLLAARGFGALLGPILGRRVIAREDRYLWSVLGAAMTVFGVGYMVLPLAHWLWLAMLVVVFAHLGGGGNWILSTYGLQTIVPDRVRGRVFSVDYMISTVVIAVSQASAGALADRADPRWVSFGLGSLVLLYAAGWLVATRSFRRVPAGVPVEV
ncbi:MAG TPA: MFS transporter [Mycobacteriales bacterium]|jgi:MFS family permease|nr:MFS transporter [Mycobacteriales bacterium]